MSSNPSSSFIKDLPSSLVVFLVALPLSLGIAVASGAPVQAGLIAAVIGGIVVGVLGGAPLQVSGPAAGLSVMVYGFVQKFGFETTCVIASMAGILQIAAGSAGIAQAALAISPAVLQAMLAGIGILIALGQMHVLLGHTPKGSALNNIMGLADSVPHVNVSALIVGASTLIVIILWNRFVSKKVRLIPGSLVAIVVGTAVSLFVPGEIPHVSIGSGIFKEFHLPSLGGHPIGDLVLAALALFVVASAESLLCAVATDQLHSGPRANLNRELFAQGVGNTLSGLVGGLPVTGVIVRSSANIAADAKTRLSAILHGVWMLVFVLLFSGLLARVPMAALAALLVHVGVNLVKTKEIRKIAEFNEVIVYAVTLAGVVFINLLWGIGIGFALALVLLLRRTAKVNLATETRGEEIHVTLQGHLSFLSVPAVMSRLRALPAAKTVHMRFEVDQIDHAAIEAIRAWRVGYQNAGGKVIKEPLDVLWRELLPRPLSSAA
ncbi:SulP family inorganic anion transporter [Stigmatella sp. ncwal1]|uniref:SulP family inorganic anion transporter n=1 Tax=Stigmatella ashevillensis TaxID=2995309 RepID=A0ABT5D2Q1_9BACT|nr:SulP family inorganic anion transporter [Stigmatella ashevillena]MDC0707841.1 SulP family inorganic anion transporter [Stigmatella ashevillena]